ncbi:carboxylating nicotinate-nucleotide diphosphorylase [Acidithiobacillus sp. AMEEHan]|uniref:carboxylating nicotinate-nucleotide diphosphorylase n=1 Tax=Acidithiobacillus sp. AMEEHan TaxID=2994951 RepID=UPI0027E5A187|nr:carboxylating nicotinate-nucleotide diphosphorylase [Acidithiobacillus sp. AMEEHan]
MLPADITESVRHALAEDLGSGDLSAALIAPRQELQARIISREAGVLCGQPYVEAVFAQLSADLQVDWQVTEGAEIAPEQVLCTLHGPARALLTGERSALNFLQLLSATATQTRAFVERLQGSSTRLLDTRKTLPGLRLAQKYAVRVGGGHNHRLGLFDGILIKENHLAAIGGIAPAVARARALAPVLTRVEVEVETLEQLDEAVAAGADMVLLDNFSLPALREAVARVARRIPLEASGNISLETVTAVAATGVDYLSVGSITRNVQSLDLSLRYL